MARFSTGLGSDVQVTTCGCMGLCDEGPVIVVYPEGVWYRRVQPSDVAEIVQHHLLAGKSVDRLIWNDAPAMKAMSVEHSEKFRAAMAVREKAGALPDHLNEMIRGFMPSRCILTALELDLFNAVGDGANAEQIGARVNANARAVAMLLNALVSLGLLTKNGDDYRNTPESARFFVQGSKDSARDGLLHTANIWHRWSTLTEAVRGGTRVPIDGDGNPEWTPNFIAGMQRNAKDRAPLVVKALGIENVPPHSGSRGRLRGLLDCICQSVCRSEMRDPRFAGGGAANSGVRQPGRRLRTSEPSRWRHASR